MNKHRDYDFKNGGFVNKTEKRQYLSDTNQEGLKMKKYSVLMTTADYVEVEANTPEEAELLAEEMYSQGEIRPEHPTFLCEEADEVTK